MSTHTQTHTHKERSLSINKIILLPPWLHGISVFFWTQRVIFLLRWKVNDLEQVRQQEQKHNVSSLPPVQNYFHLCIQTHKERASGGVRIYGMTKSLIVVSLCAVNPRRPFSSWWPTMFAADTDRSQSLKTFRLSQMVPCHVFGVKCVEEDKKMHATTRALSKTRFNRDWRVTELR